MKVYKYLYGEKFYKHMQNYLDGKLYFADWHQFDDKKEGKYLSSSTITNPDYINELERLKEAKQHYKVCSTTTDKESFDLWSRYMEKVPVICLEIEVGDTRVNPSEFDEWKERLFKNGNFLSGSIDYIKKLKSRAELDLLRSDDEKAIAILSTKLLRWTYEQEYRFIKNDENPDMLQIGDVTSVIIGGCCDKSDSCFNHLRVSAYKHKPYIPIRYAYINYEYETVEIEDDADLCRNALRNNNVIH